LAEEQEALDNNDDQVSELSVRIQQLITLASKGQGTTQVATKHLTLLQAKLESVDAAIHDIEGNDEDVMCILEEYKDQVIAVKTKLALLKATLLASDATPSYKTTLACKGQPLNVKKRLRTFATPVPKPSESTATKLPRLELPTFHGDILKWKNFWEQFCVSVQTFPRKRS